MKETPLLKVGHILLTLNRQEDSTFSCFYNLCRMGRIYFGNVYFVEGNLPRMGSILYPLHRK